MNHFRYDQVDWNRLFSPQHGGSRFVGFLYQRGGNLASLFPLAMRLIPLASSPIGHEIIAQTKNAISDIATGADPLNALKSRGRQAIRNLTGLGPRKRMGEKRKLIRNKRARTKQSLFIPAL